ncbi:MAG TPA: M48 family metalloprotease [Rudaea sp.]|jgi:predicted Zn-dependent protease|nr:M48 family metalloprotease [Rudaea sp.]
MRRFLLTVLPFLACTLLAGTPARANDQQLPNMGSSAGAIASPEEQREYGFYMLHELRNQGEVLDDALLTDYINMIGYRLVAYSPKPDQPFTFFVVRDTSINAFALPGGFVGVNAGLITTTANENELAAVLAHEISHVTQQHLVRAVEAEQKYAPLMVLAMVGAIVATAHQSPYNTSNSGVGAIATAEGLAEQMQINFTRADESEADRIGMQTLAKAGYDPDAMADFFERMQHALRPGFDENDVPALLMDHPVTNQRISEARERAEALRKGVKPTIDVGKPCEPGATCPKTTTTYVDPKPNVMADDLTAAVLMPTFTYSPTSPLGKLLNATGTGDLWGASSEEYYELMRERVRVLSSAQPAQTATYYSDNLHNDPQFNTTPNRYGYALALLNSGEAKKAESISGKLLEKQPNNLVLQLAAGESELLTGERDASLKRYVSLETEYPDNRALAMSQAQALLQNGEKKSARHAQEILRPQLEKNDEDPDMQTLFARACELAGDPIRAGEAHAAAAYLNGRAEDALNQLKDLLKRNDLDYYQRSRIEARISEFTPIVLELRRRKIKPADQGKFAVSACVAATCEALSSGRNNKPLQ